MVRQAEESTKTTEKIPPELSKQINLPFYSDKNKADTPVKNPGVVTETVETYVRATRLQFSQVASTISRFNSSVASKYNTAKAHSLGVVEFIQSEPELWQRCGIVAAAGLTGFIAGYRRTSLVKTRNLLLGSGVAAAICWPKQTVEAFTHSYNYVKEPVLDLWTQYSPGSPYQPRTTSTVPPSKFYNNPRTVQEDQGQSSAEDKDMYSTRGS